MERLSEKEHTELEQLYLNDKVEGTLFANFYNSIIRNANEEDDLFPEEVWKEAKEQLRHIYSISNKELVFSNLRKRLEQRYAIFDNGYSQEKRTKSQRQRTASIVMIAMFFQLLCTNIDSLEDNPYKSLILALFDDMKSDPYILQLYNEIAEEETKNDNRGNFVVQKDYLADVNSNNLEKPIICPLINITKDQETFIVPVLKEASNQTKNKKSKYDGANRDHLSCALVALQEIKKIPQITTHYDEIYNWLCFVLNTTISYSDFRECFDTNSNQKRKKTENYIKIFEDRLK